jgi:hypothetical protein
MVLAMDNAAALEAAITLTNQILVELDQQQGFDRVDALEAKREPLVQQAFAPSLQVIDQIKAVHLQNLNRKVVEKLSNLKQTIQKEHQQASNGTRATRAYQSQQGQHPSRS